MRWTTSSGMSRHGSNGLGSTVSITGHLIVVVTWVIGTSVASSRAGPAPEPAGGAVCQTRITAATSADTAASRRALAPITPLQLESLPGVYKSAAAARTGNENMF